MKARSAFRVRVVVVCVTCVYVWCVDCVVCVHVCVRDMCLYLCVCM